VLQFYEVIAITNLHTGTHMNRFTKALLGASLFATVVTATGFGSAQNFDAEFDRMQNFINSVMNSNVSNSYFNKAYPKMDIEDKEKSYILTFNLAGTSKDEIELSLEDNNILTIRGEKKSNTVLKKKNYVKREIFSGKFQRSITLPEDADAQTLKTEYRDGILKVMLEKKKIKKISSKIIPIN
jgi:HSP20 family protein